MSTRKINIVVLAGDGIGPEVTEQAVRVLKAVAEAKSLDITFDHHLIGGAAIDATGVPLPDNTLAAAKNSSAVILGAVGGPKWNDPKVRPEQGLLAIRQAMGLFANLRPVSIFSDSLLKSSPLKEDIVKGTDIMFVRELTGGAYFGKRGEETNGYAFDTIEYSVDEVTRIARLAGQLARARSKKVIQVDKANVLATSRLWRTVTTKVFAQEFSDVKLEHMLVDTASMQIVRNPSQFDVVLTENLFGDILTDEAAVLPGSIGLLPSASLNSSSQGLYEPIHGSAPDIAGQGKANPIGAIASVALLLQHSLQMPKEAEQIILAIKEVLDAGHKTADLVKSGEKYLSTTEIADAIIVALKKILSTK